MRENEVNLVEKAKEIATKAHNGQKRWGGEPFITHPEAIAKMARKMRLGEDVEVLSWLHDVKEDCGVTDDELRKEGIPFHIIYSLNLVTHEDGVSYLDYLLKICPNQLAARVKSLDLAHNLHTSQKKHVNSRDKWLLAQWIMSEHGYPAYNWETLLKEV